MKTNLPKILSILCGVHLTTLIVLGASTLSTAGYGYCDLWTYILNFITILSYGHVLVNIMKKEK